MLSQATRQEFPAGVSHTLRTVPKFLEKCSSTIGRAARQALWYAISRPSTRLSVEKIGTELVDKFKTTASESVIRTTLNREKESMGWQNVLNGNDGAGGGTRTHDLRVKSAELYRLSYARMVRAPGFEPGTSGFRGQRATSCPRRELVEPLAGVEPATSGVKIP